MRRRNGTVAVTIVLVLLGFLGAIQWKSQSASEGLQALSVQELGELVANLTTRSPRRSSAATRRRSRSARTCPASWAGRACWA
jgi:hypothetical protein